MAVLSLDRITFPVLYRKFSWVQFIEYIVNPFHNISVSSFHFISPICTLRITSRKRRSLTPYSKLRRAYTVDIASRSDLGQWLVHDRQFYCPPNAPEAKRESREARDGYRITCPKRIWGWTVCKNRDRTRAIKRRGIPQDVDTVRERTSISRMHLSSYI
jgi:hypothetical protein